MKRIAQARDTVDKVAEKFSKNPEKLSKLIGDTKLAAESPRMVISRLKGSNSAMQHTAEKEVFKSSNVRE